MFSFSINGRIIQLIYITDMLCTFQLCTVYDYYQIAISVKIMILDNFYRIK